MKIGKPVKYENKRYWLGDVREAMVGLKRTQDAKDVKWISRNAVDPKAKK